MATEFNRTTFPSRNLEDANEISHLFDGLFDPSWQTVALATCRFQFQGPKSVGIKEKNWGEWVRTRIQTGGLAPTGFGTDREHARQHSTNTWVSLDSREIVSKLLDCVGLTIENVYDEFGKPEVGQRYVVDLMTIVRKLTGLIEKTGIALDKCC